MAPHLNRALFVRLQSLKVPLYLVLLGISFALQIFFGQPTETSLIFSASWGMLCLGFACWIGQLSAIRIIPRKSDLFVNTVVGGCFAVLLTPNQQYVLFLFIGCCAGALSFVGHVILAELAKRRSARPVIIIDLPPLERAIVLKELSAQGLLFYFDIADRVKLEILLDREQGHRVALVLIGESSLDSLAYDQILFRARLHCIPIVRFQHLLASLCQRIDLRFVTAWSLLEGGSVGSSLTPHYQKVKNFVEPLVAVFLLMGLLPFAAAIALGIRLTTRGPVLYRQQRLGLSGTPFTLYKFRSMSVDAENSGPQWATDTDVRVTGLGKVLRRTRLDEMPQLINIIRGEMGFIGPRPERPEFHESITGFEPLFPMRLLVKPGLTGWAQVSAGYANSIESSRRKLEYDLYYLLYASLRLDIIITVATVLRCCIGDTKDSLGGRPQTEILILNQALNGKF